MKRRHQLDFFRGFFLIIITVDHFLTDDNIIKRFTYGFIGWVTAAEGFVFLSGLTAGIVYSYKLSQKGQRFIVTASFKRAWQIYRNHILVLLLVFLLVLFNDPIRTSWADNFFLLFHRPVLAVIMSLTLLYQPYLNDVLPMYALFVLLVPLVVGLFNKGYVWQVFAVSGFLYILGILVSTYDLTSEISWYKTFGRGHYNLFSWQLLFLLGLYSGFLYFNKKTKVIQRSKNIFYVSIAVAIGLFIVKSAHIEAYKIVQIFVDGAYVAPLRLVNFWALFMIAVYLSTKYASKFSYAPFCYLGRYSLEVFSWHILLVIVFRPLEIFLNTFHPIRLSSHFYFHPFSTLLLLFFILPSLYLGPVLLSKSARPTWLGGTILPRAQPDPLPVGQE